MSIYMYACMYVHIYADNLWVSIRVPGTLLSARKLTGPESPVPANAVGETQWRSGEGNRGQAIPAVSFFLTLQVLLF